MTDDPYSDLCDRLSELCERAKEAQDRAAQARAQSHNEIQSRITTVRATADQRRQQAATRGEGVNDEPASSWGRLRAHVDDQMKKMRAKMDESHDKHDAKAVEWQAEWAHTNALDAVGFAYDAVVEAEGAVLEAIDLRAAADEKASSEPGS